jgi:phage anti-repressor protein
MKKNSIFITLLKKHTNIDTKFIDTFFKKFKLGGDLEFDIKDSKVAKYLGIELQTLRNRLLNKYSKKKTYFENVDYVKIKSKTSSAGITYMINYQCFERLAMSGDSEQSEVVRMYFVKVREFVTENQHLIFQTMENKSLLNKHLKYESIYFFAVDERKMDFKAGRTIDIVSRLNNYNVGRLPEVDLKYFALVKNSILIEKCIKLKLKNNQVIKNKEIYRIDPATMKKVIEDCYCKYVSQDKHVELYKEISDVLGLFMYTKGKVNISPYIIIGKDL